MDSRCAECPKPAATSTDVPALETLAKDPVVSLARKFAGDLSRRVCRGGPTGEDMLSQTPLSATDLDLRLLKPGAGVAGSMVSLPWARAGGGGLGLAGRRRKVD
jgi:hypothetical protein